MPNYEKNVYSNPEANSLTMIGSIDMGESYEFDIFAVWTHPERGLLIGRDAGCS